MRTAAALLALLSACALLAEEPRAEGKTATVVAEGVGATAKDARAAALRDAVSKVVGSLIDAETVVKNDEVIGEKVLEFSGGFVTTYDELKTEKTADGLVRVRIRAVVERAQVAAKLADSGVTARGVRGADLLAEKMTKEEARKNATGLLAKLFADLPGLMRAEVAGKPVLSPDGDAVLLDMTVGVDQKGYGEFVKRAVPLLDKLAVAKDSVLLTAAPDEKNRDLMRYDEKAASVFGRPKPGGSLPKGWAVWLLTSIDARGQKARWNFYWVDSEAGESLKPLRGAKTLGVSLTGDRGETIAEEEVSLERDAGEYPVARPLGPLCVLYQAGVRRTDPSDAAESGPVLIVSPLALGVGANFCRHAEVPTYSDLFALYALRPPLRVKIALADAELERVKKIKASVTLKPPAPGGK